MRKPYLLGHAARVMDVAAGAAGAIAGSFDAAQLHAQPPAPRVPPMVEEFTVNPLGFLSDATSQQLEAEFARQKAVNVCDLGFIGEPLP